MIDKQMQTRLTEAKLRKMHDALPCTVLENGHVVTCPVRISHPFLFDKSKPMQDGGAWRWMVTLLFWKGADLTVLEQEAAKACAKRYGPDWEDEGIIQPFRDQHDKPKLAKKAGHVAGAIFMRASASETQPQIIDRNCKPIKDKSQVYSGQWALVTLRPYCPKVEPARVTFGLQNVMILCDDERLGGGQVEAADEFGEISALDELDTLFAEDASDALSQLEA